MRAASLLQHERAPWEWFPLRLEGRAAGRNVLAALRLGLHDSCNARRFWLHLESEPFWLIVPKLLRLGVLAARYERALQLRLQVKWC